MRKRQRGRPRREMERVDAALAAFGGARAFLRALDAEGLPYGEMAAKVEAITGIRVAAQTIANWLQFWQQQDLGERKEVVA